MKKNKKIFIGAILVAIVGFSVLSIHSFVAAQNPEQGLAVSPPSQEVTVDPGRVTTVKAKIRNTGNQTLSMQVHIEDFTAKGDEGQVELTANSPYSIASWTKLSPTTFKLAPGTEQEVSATITTPKNAAGGHFGSFIFQVVSDQPKNNAASLSQEIASLFLVRVSGPVNEKLSIKEFTAPEYSEFGPITFSMKFANSGNVHTKAYGLINVTDMFGKKVADIVVPGTNIFPQADRVVTASLPNRFLFGSYTATALMYYGSKETQSLTATTTFFVFPTRIAGGILIILFLLFLMRKRLRKALRALGGK